MAPHLARAHGMNTAQYREAHRLPRKLSLRAADLSRRASEQGKDRYASRPDIRAALADGPRHQNRTASAEGTRATANYPMVVQARRRGGQGHRAASRRRIEERAQGLGYTSLRDYFAAHHGAADTEIARALGLDRSTVKTWRTRLAEEAASEDLVDPGAPALQAVPGNGRPTVVTLTAFGETKTLADWSRDPRCPVSYFSLRRRVQASTGEDAEEIIMAHPARRPPSGGLTAFGETKSLADWARDPRCPVSYYGLRHRVRLLPDADAEMLITAPPGELTRPCRGCGKPLPVTGLSRCRPCHATRRRSDYASRRRAAMDAFPAEMRAELLQRVAAGRPLQSVCADLGVTMNRVNQFDAHLPGWREVLDHALRIGRDPNLPHGRDWTYTHHGCRCPDCRGAHDACRKEFRPSS